LLDLAIAIIAVMILFFAYNFDVQSSANTFSGGALVFVTLVAVGE